MIETVDGGLKRYGTDNVPTSLTWRTIHTILGLVGTLSSALTRAYEEEMKNAVRFPRLALEAQGPPPKPQGELRDPEVVLQELQEPEIAAVVRRRAVYTILGHQVYPPLVVAPVPV
jgi:hypothetical protein